MNLATPREYASRFHYGARQRTVPGVAGSLPCESGRPPAVPRAYLRISGGPRRAVIKVMHAAQVGSRTAATFLPSRFGFVRPQHFLILLLRSPNHHQFVDSLVLLPVRSIFHWIVRHSLIQSVVPSCTHSYVQSFIHPSTQFSINIQILLLSTFNKFRKK